MKTKITGLLFIGLTVFALGACKKDKKASGGSGVTIPVTTANKFEGTVDGILKAATTITGTYTMGDSGPTINGAGNGFNWGMFADIDVVAGQTYNLSTGDFLIAYSPNAQGNGGFISESGTVNVIKNDTVNNILEVNFQGIFQNVDNASSSIAVTGGHVYVTYTE